MAIKIFLAMDQYSGIIEQIKPAVKPNQLQYLLEIAKVENYTNLYINYENLEEIPREVLEITSIQGLFLKRNLLKSLPPDLWKLPLLKTLYLPSNQLTSLPEEIGKCVNLERLNIDSNCLKLFPKTIGELTKLKTLQASSNELEFIPPEIGQLKSLEILELMNNSIQCLPEELSKCTNLRSLFVDGNLIQELPRILLTLSRLQDLSLSRNYISHLPHELNRLCKLKSLVLDNNKDLTVIPASVFGIPHLQILGLHGSGSSNVGQSVVEILAEYSNIQEFRKVMGNVVTLLELCLRNAPDTKQQELLPKPLQTLLKTPKGCCHLCSQRYYVNAFFETCDSLYSQVLTLIQDKLYTQIKDSNCYFIFCFCSYNCFKEFVVAQSR
ncbi:Leucine-rich repeat-containing 28 [Paramuricea clavata]|uniref:Leucine-rich repeat-containing 28 n=1 Tax=Paramuricea clavata TaxID=317549 RepID=A0A6S7I3T4_PARCT|nr:Leucine-rich repeat-containing 28 [Paramuricea clavata]